MKYLSQLPTQRPENPFLASLRNEHYVILAVPSRVSPDFERTDSALPPPTEHVHGHGISQWLTIELDFVQCGPGILT